MQIPQKSIRFAVIVGMALMIGTFLYPVHNRMLELGWFAGLILLWLATLASLSARKTLRIIVFFLPFSAAIPFVLPEKKIDPDVLCARYVERLQAYDGTRYVWGGESSLGIDCSGLPRKSLRDALLEQGWRNANGAAFRMWLSHWWHDTSAFAMSQGYRGFTRPLGIKGQLWNLADSPIRPGDLAVRGDGGHVVVYLGNREWIEADPNRGKVHRWISSPSDGGWYENMTVHRWVGCE